MTRAEGSLVKDMKRGLAKVSHKKNSSSDLLVTLYGFDCALNFVPCQEPATCISSHARTAQPFTPGARRCCLLASSCRRAGAWKVGIRGPGGKVELGCLCSLTGQRVGIEIFSWFKPIYGCGDEVARTAPHRASSASTCPGLKSDCLTSKTKIKASED